MRQLVRALPLVVALAAALSFAAAQAATSARPASPKSAAQAAGARGLPARTLIGMPVLDRTGQPLGRLDDLVVRMRTGEVRYAVVSRQADWGEPLKYLVAAGSLRSRAQTLAADLDAPEFDARFIPLTQNDSGRIEDAVHDALERMPGARPEPGSLRWSLRCASSLLDATVDTQDGTRIGTVQELIVDVDSATVRFAVVAFGEAGRHARPIGLPLSAFRPAPPSASAPPRERLAIAIRAAGPEAN